MRVLVADEDFAVRRAVSKVLRDAGYEVVLARDSQETLGLVNSQQIDLVILDLGLPIRDGWDVFEQMTTKAPVLPIIVITGLVNQRDLAVEAGLGALLEKPLDAPQLLQTMETLLAESMAARLNRLGRGGQDLRPVPSSGTAMLRQLRARQSALPRRRITDQTGGS